MPTLSNNEELPSLASRIPKHLKQIYNGFYAYLKHLNQQKQRCFVRVKGNGNDCKGGAEKGRGG